MYRNKQTNSSKARDSIVGALLASLAEKNSIKEENAKRVAELCQRLGKKAGLSARQLRDLALLVKVYDLGQVGIPDHLFSKKTRLTKGEWELLKQHPEKGFRIASASPSLAGVAPLIQQHHERWDGKGYPLGISGEDIPMECRILAIVEAYQAMNSPSPYRRLKSQEVAIIELKKCAGSQFDPALVEMFLDIIQEDMKLPMEESS